MPIEPVLPSPAALVDQVAEDNRAVSGHRRSFPRGYSLVNRAFTGALILGAIRGAPAPAPTSGNRLFNRVWRPSR